MSPCQNMKCIDLSVYFSFIVAKCESNLCNVEALRDLKVELIARKDVSMIIWASTRENQSSVVANDKSADQPVHLGRLISAFVVHFLEIIISKLASGEIKIFLTSLCRLEDWFESRLVGNPEDPILSRQGQYGSCCKEKCLLSLQPGRAQSGPKVIKLFSCPTQMSINFPQLIEIKMLKKKLI